MTPVRSENKFIKNQELYFAKTLINPFEITYSHIMCIDLNTSNHFFKTSRKAVYWKLFQRTLRWRNNLRIYIKHSCIGILFQWRKQLEIAWCGSLHLLSGQKWCNTGQHYFEVISKSVAIPEISSISAIAKFLNLKLIFHHSQ